METKYKVNNLLMIPLNTFDNYINIPEKILDSITKKKYNPPFYFKLSVNNGLKTFVGVKEFTAEKQTIEVPSHLINYLGNEKGNLCLVNDIPKGEFVKLKVDDESFYNIPEYDVFLTNELSKYCLLEKDKDFIVKIMDKEFIFKIMELKIKLDENLLVDYDLVDIVNIDLKVDFERDIKTEKLNFDFGETKNKFEEIKETPVKVNKLSREEMRKRRIEYYDNLINKENL